MKRLLIVAAAAILLAGCGSDVHDGEVVGKDFSPAHCTTTYVLVGKVPVPVTTCYSDEWDLKLKNCGSGECKTGWVEVSEATYDGAQTGSYYKAKP